MPQDRYRERDSGIEVGAVRVEGWIVWDGDGMRLVPDETFQATFERADGAGR